MKLKLYYLKYKEKNKYTQALYHYLFQCYQYLHNSQFLHHKLQELQLSEF